MSAPPENYFGGVWCHEVIDLLPDYVDGQLPKEHQRAAVAHLAKCNWCARFGGEYASTVRALRDHALPAPPVDVLERLKLKLDEQ